MELVKKVHLCEVGPRDGLQNEPNLFTVEEKVELINQMIKAGFKFIEAGSFVSPKVVPQMGNTDEVFKALKPAKDVELRALIANAKGVDRAVACGCKKVKLNVSASKAHNLANLNKTPEESVAGFQECVEKALANGIGISGSISMAFGSPWDKEIRVKDVKKIVRAYLKVGVTEISLSDASGMAYPSQIYDMCMEMKQEFPQVEWWLHFLNTRGLGIANIMAGMQAGITNFDSSFAGVGGCPFVPGAAGNVSTEDIVHMLDEMKVESGIDLNMVMEVARKVVSLVGHSTDSYLLRAGKSKDLILELPEGQLKTRQKPK